MNRLGTERRGQVISCLTEGMSIQATVWITGVAKNTIVKLLCELGKATAVYQDRVLRSLDTTHVECDEIWSFCYSKQKNVPDGFKGTLGYGDVWTWTAIDVDTKLVPSWIVGERTNKDAYFFLKDLHSRLKNRVQLTTDGHRQYLMVIEPLFGADNVDFTTLKRIYDYSPEGMKNNPEQSYSPDTCTGIEKIVITDQLNPTLISTSYVERQNLTMRMGMRRFTDLTNGFSKKIENLAHAVSLHYMYYNFARPHQTLTEQFGKSMTPAMASEKADHVWSTLEIAELLD